METAATIEVEPEPERLAPGTLVGDYEVESYLGAGAMGQVYAGKHPVIGKRVAIKVLRREMSAEPDAAIRFIREARAANQVAHPNVIDIFAFGTMPDGRLYLVMDLVDGQSLRALIREGTVELATALDILAQIADALDAAHAKGVVHRDLKPDNVMIAEGPKIFVLDFGLAKLAAVGGTSAIGVCGAGGALTAKGTWIGTPGYMAPEQWSADGAVAASDRYALGVIAFELLSGKLPFSAPSLPQMMEQHFRSPVPALSARGAVSANAAFDPVLARAMAKDPDARFPTARAFVQALRDAAAGKVFRFPTQRRAWLPAGAALGVLGLGVVGVLAVRNRDTRTVRDEKAPPAARFRIDIITQPAGARLARGDTQLGMTPFPLELAPGEKAQLELRKPGYRSERREITGAGRDDAVRVDLTPVNGFEGVWMLPDGQLRAFQRTGEHVDVFKLDAVDGPRAFYQRFELVDAPSGVAFAHDENLPDERGTNDPSCQISHHVEYRYEPKADALEVRPEHVETGRQNGHCFVKLRRMGDPIALVRADRSSEDTRRTRAPVGDVKLAPAPTTRKPPAKPTPADKVAKPPPAPPVKGKGKVDPVAQKKLEEAKKLQTNAPPVQKSLDKAPDDDAAADQVQQSLPPPQAPPEPAPKAPNAQPQSQAGAKGKKS